MSESKQISIEIAEAKELIKRGSDIEKLVGTPLFKRVVEEGYFKEFASQLVLQRATPSGRDNQENIDADIAGIGAFRQYLNSAIQLGKYAKNRLDAMEETQEEILAEEGEA